MADDTGTGCQCRSFLSSYLSEPEPDVKRSITLSDLLNVLDRDSYLIVTRRVGPNTKEAMFCGTVRQLLDVMKAGRFKDFLLEQIEPDVWEEGKFPCLIATVGIHKERPPPIPQTSRTAGREAKKSKHPYYRVNRRECQAYE